MAWENASGFGSKVNPIELPSNLLSAISNNTSATTDLGSGSGGSLPTGVVVNTNYIDFQSTGGRNNWSLYESDSTLTWNYSRWTNGSREGAGIQLIVNNVEVATLNSTEPNPSSNPIYTYGFVINNDTHKAKIIMAYTESNYHSVIAYPPYMHGVEYGTELYNALVQNPYGFNRSGGAGSGYIGNPLLSNKKMVGYNVPTSSAESTKTESVNEASETPVSGKPKIGNGFARIKFLRDVQPQPEPGYDDILNKFQNYIIWGSWDFKNHDVRDYSGSSAYTCDYPMCIINKAEMLQTSDWATNGDSYFCGKARCDIDGQDGVGYSITISEMVDSKPIHNGSTDYNHATQLIYNNGKVATSLYHPNLVTLPNKITKNISYSTVTLRNALSRMIDIVVGNCSLFVNGIPWILV